MLCEVLSVLNEHKMMKNDWLKCEGRPLGLYNKNSHFHAFVKIIAVERSESIKKKISAPPHRWRKRIQFDANSYINKSVGSSGTAFFFQFSKTVVQFYLYRRRRQRKDRAQHIF